MPIEILKKKVKHFTLRVKPTGEVTLTVPLKSKAKDIEHILKKRAKWIEEKVAFFEAHNSHRVHTQKEYVSGENAYYLGRKYRLKIIESQTEEVKLQRAYLQIFVKDTTNIETKKNLLETWYKTKAQIHFDKAINKYQAIVKKEIKVLRIKQMKTRWGSCNSSKGYINLNLKLIEKPTECIEYVVFHELSHLIHADHSVRFYNYMSLFMPDWKKRKEKLERH